jgi:rhamnosyltransferase
MIGLEGTLDLSLVQIVSGDNQEQSRRSTSVAAIIVTYNPDYAALLRGLSAIAKQVGFIVIVDNASRDFLSWQVELFGKTLGIEICIISLQKNVGLGAGFNMGITKVKSLDFSFVILFDQDSIPHEGMIKLLGQAYEDLSETNSYIAAVGPRFLNPENQELSNFTHFGRFSMQQVKCNSQNGIVQAAFLISSGSYISIKALDEVGCMDETLFIDYVDTEWCLRARSKGWLVYGVCNAIMEHSLGEKRRRYWLLRWRNIAQHSPFRYYYIFRNSLILSRRSYILSNWARCMLIHNIMLAIYLVIATPNRVGNIKMIIQGIFDGIKGVSGPILSRNRE